MRLQIRSDRTPTQPSINHDFANVIAQQCRITIRKRRTNERVLLKTNGGGING